MKQPKKLRALIFDFDGTIADTEGSIYTAVAEVFADHGTELSLDRWRELVGTVTSETIWLDWLEEAVGPVNRGALLTQAGARNSELVAALRPLPGVERLIADATAAGLGLAVASSSPHDWVDPMLDRLGLSGRFSVVCCRDDVEFPKPAPDLVLAALRGLGVDASEAVMIEDSAHGAAAAASADVRCVVVPHRITAASDFGAQASVVDSLAHVSLGDLALLIAVQTKPVA